MAEKEIKSIKVLDVTFNREWKSPKNMIYYFNMKVEGPEGEIEGQFSTVKKDQNKFEIGKQYEVAIEVKQNTNGLYNFFDLSEAEKERRKAGGYSGKAPGYSGPTKGGWVRSRKEVLSIISQSSYEAAALVAVKIGKEVIKSHTGIASISKQLTNYVCEVSGLNSEACKKGDKDALKAANDRSIVYQKALKIAVICLDLPLMEETLATGINFKSTQGIVSVTDMICVDINKIAEEA